MGRYTVTPVTRVEGVNGTGLTSSYQKKNNNRDMNHLTITEIWHASKYKVNKVHPKEI